MPNVSKSLITVISKKIADPSAGNITRVAALAALPIVAIGTGAAVVAKIMKKKKTKRNK